MRVRRRIVLAVALASLAAAVWAAAPALSVNPYVPRVVQFSMRVPAISAVGSGARAAGGAPVTTPVLHAAKHFDLFGGSQNLGGGSVGTSNVATASGNMPHRLYNRQGT